MLPSRVYNFPEILLGNGDQLRLTLTFYNQGLQNPPVIIRDAQSLGIIINNIGFLEHDYDFEKFFAVPGEYNFKLIVPETSEIYKMMFTYDDPEFGQFEKTPAVRLEIKYNQTNDWEDEFLGNVLLEDVSYNARTQILDLVASPETDKINKQMIYNINNEPLNPFNYEVPDSNRTFFYRIEKIILDIFKKMNPDITLDIKHNWNFKAEWNQNYDHNNDYLIFPNSLGTPPSEPLTYSDFIFTELFQDIRPLFFDTSYGLNSLGDILRKLAIDWGCFTGLITRDKAFFKNIFTHNEVYNLTSEAYYENNLTYKMPIYDYILYHTPGGDYDAGTFTTIEGKYLERKSLVSYIKSVHTNIVAIRDHTYDVIQSSTPTDGWKAYGRAIVDYWFNIRSVPSGGRVDTIITPDINHSIIKNPIFNNTVYQPIYIKKMYKDCKTQIDGIIVG